MVINKEKNFISAVVYVRNNESDIEHFLENICKILNDNFDKYEIICVDDGSTDKSSDVIKAYTPDKDGVVITLINMGYFQGSERSMNAGVDLAIGDFVLEFDCVYIDYDKNTVMDVYFHSLKGFDIVSASNLKLKRRTSELFYKLFNKYSNNPIALKSETFRIISRRAINRIQTLSKTVPYRKAIYANCGLQISSISYIPIPDSANKNKKQFKNERIDLATNSLILFTDIAYRVSLSMTFIFLFSIFFVALYTLIVFLKGNPVAGWTTTMLFLSVAFFGIFAFFAIIIKYLSIITDLIFKKVKYTIESIEKITK